MQFACSSDAWLSRRLRLRVVQTGRSLPLLVRHWPVPPQDLRRRPRLRLGQRRLPERSLRPQDLSQQPELSRLLRRRACWNKPGWCHDTSLPPSIGRSPHGSLTPSGRSDDTRAQLSSSPPPNRSRTGRGAVSFRTCLRYRRRRRRSPRPVSDASRGLSAVATADAASKAGALPSCPSFASGVATGRLASSAPDRASGVVEGRRTPVCCGRTTTRAPIARLRRGPSGATLALYDLDGAKANDWEDIAIGPGPVAGQSYLYVGDIGDNSTSRSHIDVYRVAEPDVRTGSPTTPRR